MNCSAYFFRELTDTGCQCYPEDGYVGDLIAKILSDNPSGLGRLVIHRDGRLMYYTYSKHVNPDETVGFCVVVNGGMLIDLRKVVAAMEETLSQMVMRGVAVMLLDDGKLRCLSGELSGMESGVRDALAFLRYRLDRQEDNITRLPPVYPAVDGNSVAYAGITDPSDDITGLLLENAYVVVDVGGGFDEPMMAHFRDRLETLDTRRNEDAEKIGRLQSEIAKLKRQKRQFRYVLVVSVVALLCFIGLANSLSNLSRTKEELRDSAELSSVREKELKAAKLTIDSLNDVAWTLNRSLEWKEHEIREISDFSPIIIGKTSCNLAGGVYGIDFYSFVEGSKTITIKVYQDDGGLYTTLSETIQLEKGTDSYSFYDFRKIFNPGLWYTFEIWIGDRLVGGSRH